MKEREKDVVLLPGSNFSTHYFPFLLLASIALS